MEKEFVKVNGMEFTKDWKRDPFSRNGNRQLAEYGAFYAGDPDTG